MSKVAFMKTRLMFVCAGLAMVTVPAAAQTQSQPGQNSVLGNLLGNIFGTGTTADQTLERDFDQGRRPFALRRDALEARIAESVASGAISRRDADAIRDEYDDIVDTEARYAVGGGITVDERRELRGRYRALVERLDDGRGPSQGGAQGPDQPADRSGSIGAQRADYEVRIATALRQRRISLAESQRLRNDLQTLVQVEAAYRRDGLDARERADLATRLTAFERRLGVAGVGNDTASQWARLEVRIAAGERNGRIARRDAAHLRTEIGDLTRLDAAYRVNGLSADERAYLGRRLAEVEARIADPRR